MPYIDPNVREFYEPELDALIAEFVIRGAKAGEFNYLVTRLALAFVGRYPDYATFAAAIGGLEAAKLEFYRRHIAPYEDAKIEQNGNVQ